MIEAAVKLSQRAKTIEKKLIYTWSTLATPPIYNQAYPEKLATASPGNPTGVTKTSLLLLFVQQHEKCLEELISQKETYVLAIFGKKIMSKPELLGVEICINSH